MTAPDPLLTIGAFARHVGLTPSALRFYDDCGLLPPSTVDVSGYRRYFLTQARRAGLLRDARAAGMPLEQVRAVLEGPPDEAAALVRAHMQAAQDAIASARRAADRVLVHLADAPAASTATVGGPELARAVRQVAGAAAAPGSASADALAALTGVLLEVDTDEVRLVATDRYRLALRVLPARQRSGPDRRVLLDAEELRSTAKTWLRCDEVHLTLSDDGLAVTAGADRALLAKRGGGFPDHHSLLTALPKPLTRVVVDRQALLNLLLDDDVPLVIALDVDAHQLIVSPPTGAPLHVLDAVCTGPALRVGFAPVVLAAALSASVGPDVLLELAAPDAVVVVRSADQGSFTTLAMPTLLTS